MRLHLGLKNSIVRLLKCHVHTARVSGMFAMQAAGSTNSSTVGSTAEMFAREIA
jgi:hypothetical protein